MTDHPPPLDVELGNPPPPSDPPSDPTRGARNMASDPFIIQTGELGLSSTDPGKPAADATLADYTDFSCRITRGILVPTTNFDRSEVPGTFCSAPSETQSPRMPSWVLRLNVLQDPDVDTVAGLHKFLADNATAITGNPGYFMLGLAAGADPKAVGAVNLVPLDFGGDPRTPLTAAVEFQVIGQPDRSYGTAVDA